MLIFFLGLLLCFGSFLFKSTEDNDLKLETCPHLFMHMRTLCQSDPPVSALSELLFSSDIV